jgi:hypothetical protein
MKWMKWLAVGIVASVLLFLGGAAYYAGVVNPRVVQELRDDPQGERAEKVMILTLPSGRALPVNYLRDGDVVYAAADFSWWHELRDGGEGPGSVFIRGETLPGHVRAVEDEPALRARVFERLRPDALSWAGTLIVIDLDTPADPNDP